MLGAPTGWLQETLQQGQVPKGSYHERASRFCATFHCCETGLEGVSVAFAWPSWVASHNVIWLTAPLLVTTSTGPTNLSLDRAGRLRMWSPNQICASWCLSLREHMREVLHIRQLYDIYIMSMLTSSSSNPRGSCG